MGLPRLDLLLEGSYFTADFDVMMRVEKIGVIERFLPNWLHATLDLLKVGGLTLLNVLVIILGVNRIKNYEPF